MGGRTQQPPSPPNNSKNVKAEFNRFAGSVKNNVEEGIEMECNGISTARILKGMLHRRSHVRQ